MRTQIKTKNKDTNKDTDNALNYKEVKTVYSDQEANLLLKQGWIFIATGFSHIDMFGYNAKATFIMAKQ